MPTEKFILVSPWAQKMRNGAENPKNYPHWQDLINKFQHAVNHIVQIGVEGEPQLVQDFRRNLPLAEIKKLLEECSVFLSVDNFLPHFAHLNGIRGKGVVLFGMSDPDLYGYPENLNILKDRKYLRKRAYGIWEEETADPSIFLTPDKVYDIVAARIWCADHPGTKISQ